MLQGFYTAASGMLMQQRSLNTIANNMANVQTPGFKANRLLSTTFEQTLMTRMEQGNNGSVGVGDPARIVDEVANIFTINGISETGRPLDVAIDGVGFFNIQAEDGQTYITRQGDFALDKDGYLVLRGQGRVMGEGGPLQPNTSDITIDSLGNITNSITNAALGKIRITNPGEDAQITKARNGMYQAAGGVGPAVANPGVVQGAVEESNVNITDETTAMMAAQRNFASASQALQMIDATYAKAVNIASL